jgi:hypothetical protein
MIFLIWEHLYYLGLSFYFLIDLIHHRFCRKYRRRGMGYPVRSATGGECLNLIVETFRHLGNQSQRELVDAQIANVLLYPSR